MTYAHSISKNYYEDRDRIPTKLYSLKKDQYNNFLNAEILYEKKNKKNQQLINHIYQKKKKQVIYNDYDENDNKNYLPNRKDDASDMMMGNYIYHPKDYTQPQPLPPPPPTFNYDQFYKYLPKPAVASSTQPVASSNDKPDKKVNPPPPPQQQQDNKSAAALINVLSSTDDKWNEYEQIFRAGLNGAIEDYTRKRYMASLRPITFELRAIKTIQNPAAEQRFQVAVDRIRLSSPQNGKILYGFHGTNPQNLRNIAENGLLPTGHPKNPSRATDNGFFGNNKKGIYVGMYADYVAKYSHSLEPLRVGDEVDIVLLKVIPGKTLQLTERKLGMDPTKGYDSHTSPAKLEWYLFDESQSLPQAIFTIRAVENKATMSDDGM